MTPLSDALKRIRAEAAAVATPTLWPGPTAPPADAQGAPAARPREGAVWLVCDPTGDASIEGVARFLGQRLARAGRDALLMDARLALPTVANSTDPQPLGPTRIWRAATLSPAEGAWKRACVLYLTGLRRRYHQTAVVVSPETQGYDWLAGAVDHAVVLLGGAGAEADPAATAVRRLKRLTSGRPACLWQAA